MTPTLALYRILHPSLPVHNRVQNHLRILGGRKKRTSVFGGYGSNAQTINTCGSRCQDVRISACCYCFGWLFGSQTVRDRGRPPSAGCGSDAVFVLCCGNETRVSHCWPFNRGCGSCVICLDAVRPLPVSGSPKKNRVLLISQPCNVHS